MHSPIIEHFEATSTREYAEKTSVGQGSSPRSDEKIHAALGELEVLADAVKAEIEDFLPFLELEQAVKDDVKFLKGNPLVDSDNVSGFTMFGMQRLGELFDRRGRRG